MKLFVFALTCLAAYQGITASPFFGLNFDVSTTASVIASANAVIAITAKLTTDLNAIKTLPTSSNNINSVADLVTQLVGIVTSTAKNISQTIIYAIADKKTDPMVVISRIQNVLTPVLETAENVVNIVNTLEDSINATLFANIQSALGALDSDVKSLGETSANTIQNILDLVSTNTATQANVQAVLTPAVIAEVNTAFLPILKDLNDFEATIKAIVSAITTADSLQKSYNTPLATTFTTVSKTVSGLVQSLTGLVAPLSKQLTTTSAAVSTSFTPVLTKLKALLNDPIIPVLNEANNKINTYLGSVTSMLQQVNESLVQTVEETVQNSDVIGGNFLEVIAATNSTVADVTTSVLKGTLNSGACATKLLPGLIKSEGKALTDIAACATVGLAEVTTAYNLANTLFAQTLQPIAVSPNVGITLCLANAASLSSDTVKAQLNSCLTVQLSSYPALANDLQNIIGDINALVLDVISIAVAKGDACISARRGEFTVYLEDFVKNFNGCLVHPK